MPNNELYLAVLPLVHMGLDNHGLTETVITLFPDKSFATEFFSDELDLYIDTFRTLKTGVASFRQAGAVSALMHMLRKRPPRKSLLKSRAALC
jgi:hypothetical protein